MFIEAMLDSVNNMSEIGARILSSVILGVDVTEVYSLVRVAAVASDHHIFN